MRSVIRWNGQNTRTATTRQYALVTSNLKGYGASVQTRSDNLAHLTRTAEGWRRAGYLVAIFDTTRNGVWGDGHKVWPL
jgi:hypothetical protein